MGRLTAVIAMLLLVIFASSPLAAAPVPAEETEDTEAAAAEADVDPVVRQERPDVLALSGPVDETEYIVGPGDRFRITIWGQRIVSHDIEVTPEGELVVPGLAAYDVAGLTLAETKADIADGLSAHYTDVDISVSLIELRNIRVHVLGAVTSPGTYIGTAMDPVSDLVKAAGGLTPDADRRNIRVTRLRGDRARADLVRYSRTGDLDSNPPILDGDTVLVPFASGYVHVYGAVAVPGSYELVLGETVLQLIELAGGFTRSAVRDTVEVRTFVDDRFTSASLIDLTDSAGRDLVLMEGDQVYVRARSDWKQVKFAVVQGEVMYPGTYGLNEGVDTLSDLLDAVGGFTPMASPHDALLVRSIDQARALDPEYERLVQMSVSELTETEYAYLKMKQTEVEGRVVVDFERLSSGDFSQDVLLRHGDRVLVPRATRTVNVAGQVVSPGLVAYEEGENYRYYLKRAGGFSESAQRGRVWVIRGDTHRRVRARRVVEIRAGDTVWVPESPERSWWDFVKEIASFATSVATIYIVIDQASSN